MAKKYFGIQNDNNSPSKSRHTFFNAYPFHLDEFQHSTKRVSILTETEIWWWATSQYCYCCKIWKCKKTWAQLKIEKPQPKNNGAFSLNVAYYIKKIFEKLDNIESRPQKKETGMQPGSWNL